MDDLDLAAAVKNIDLRLHRVEQILPTLATKQDLEPLATKKELREAVATLATRNELREAVERLETRIEEQARGFRDLVHEAVGQAWSQAQHWAKVELESMRDAIKVLTEAAAGWSPAVERVDRESRARDAALDRRILALEAQAPAPPARPRKRRR
jgi:hypothetical protein